MQNAVTEATRRLEASPAMKGLMQALQEKYGTDANDLVALTEAVRNGAVKDDAYYEKLAMEKGVSTKTARELDKLESQNKQLTEQQQLSGRWNASGNSRPALQSCRPDGTGKRSS